MRLIKCCRILIFIVLLTGCGSNNGKIYQLENLEIYYSSEIELDYVLALGDFFKDNGLINQSKQHSIKLTSNSDSFILKMILNDSLKTIPDNKLKELAYLEESIAQNVFKNLNFAIEITDAYFNPISQQ